MSKEFDSDDVNKILNKLGVDKESLVVAIMESYSLDELYFNVLGGSLDDHVYSELNNKEEQELIQMINEMPYSG